MRKERRSVKQEFLRKWIRGLRRYTSEKKNMSLLERKKAIKVSADLAMASTRDKTRRWSQAVIANYASTSKVLTDNKVNHTNCSSSSTRTTPFCRSSCRIRSRKILRRSRTAVAKVERVAASSIAKRLVQKRTRRLKSLLPGGHFMDDVSLVEETLDYIESLRTQVEVMRCLLTASQRLINNNHPSS